MSLKVDNLIDLPSGTKLKPGQRLIRIKDNIWMPVGVGGTDTPVFTGSGSTDYYRCASVDTENHTWTGYKATLNGDAYKFESTVTEGLSYSGVIPKIGYVYDTNALVTVESLYEGRSFPEEGLVFYAPLDRSRELAETGQGLDNSSEIAFDNQDGIPCLAVKPDKSSYVSVSDDSDFPFGTSPRTVSIWGKALEGVGSRFVMMGYGTAGTSYNGFTLRAQTYGSVPSFFLDIFNSNIMSPDMGSFYIWRHYTVTVDQNKLVKLYVDGVFIHQQTSNYLNTIKTTGINALLGRSSSYTAGNEMAGYVACCRIYNRVLSDEEIELLATELSPTTEETT